MTSAELGRRGIVNVMVFRSIEETRQAWGSYRQARAEAGLPAPGPDRFGHTAFVYTGDTDEEGRAVGSKLLWFLNTGLKSAPQYGKLLPGAVAPELAPGLYRTKPRPGTPVVARPAAALQGLDAEQAIAKGLMFAGNPDTVYRQILEHREKVGPYEHLVLASRSGFMTHQEATKGLRLFSRDVLPRLKELSSPTPERKVSDALHVSR
jgi:alkanesulfonate monooxygenase SsuD/methylene tetrahydromethanopterin reductase-like flavin-dependent oxidoreductase (luciferase family)